MPDYQEVYESPILFYYHENHLYAPIPTMIAAVPVIPALRLAMPNMLLLFRIAVSCALSCECPET